jgi:ribosomal subunit interface protein
MSIATSNAISWNIVNKNVIAGYTVKETLARKIGKLAKNLAGFAPETLHLQVVLEKLPKKGAFTVRLTLRMPSHILHAQKSAQDLLAAIDAAAKALDHEVKSLRSKMRGDYRWKRPAWRARLNEEMALVFAEPLEDGAGPQTPGEVVAALAASHHQHLLGHARRGLRMAELTGDVAEGAIDARDIVDEALRSCLAEPMRKPVELNYEEWFYCLVGEELNREVREFQEETRRRGVSPAETLGRSAHDGTGPAAGALLQSITPETEPEEGLLEERIPDPTVIAPGLEVAGRELVGILQDEIKKWPASEREIFELHYLVGFDDTEIAAIRRHTKEDIAALIQKIQLRLRDFLRHTTAMSAHGKAGMRF